VTIRFADSGPGDPAGLVPQAASFAGTDGFVVGVAEVAAQRAPDAAIANPLFFPGEQLQRVARFLRDAEGAVALIPAPNGNGAWFRARGRQIHTRCVQGKVLPFETVLAGERECAAEVDTARLKRTLQLAQQVAGGGEAHRRAR